MLLPLIAHTAEAGRDTRRHGLWVAAVRGEPGLVERLPAGDREDARLDLVWRDVRRRPGARLEDHCLASVPDDLVEEEYLARHSLPHGDFPGLDDYERRFPAAVPRLRRRLIAGRFVLLRLLGRGAMGEVWEACDRRTRSLVALKRPATPGPRFREEIRLLGRLSHPGVAGIVAFEDGDEPWYAMSLVEGPTLAALIRTASRGELLERFVAVCDAVAHAHSRGVLHRDLKPGNVIAGRQTVVVDWGMAGGAGACERLGTPEYMAPEQAGGFADERSDVFGLGAILYEILARRAPVKEGVVASRPAGVPRRLAAICMKALAEEPAKRPAGAAALASEVRAFLGAPWWARLW